MLRTFLLCDSSWYKAVTPPGSQRYEYLTIIVIPTLTQPNPTHIESPFGLPNHLPVIGPVSALCCERRYEPGITQDIKALWLDTSVRGTSGLCGERGGCRVAGQIRDPPDDLRLRASLILIGHPDGSKSPHAMGLAHLVQPQGSVPLADTHARRSSPQQ